MRTASALIFAAGLLLAVRVMFFGVRRSVGADFTNRASRLAAAAALAVGGATSYVWASLGGGLTAGWAALVLVLSGVAAAGAWWLVRVSAAAGSADPEDDPRFMYQGFVGRVVRPIQETDSDGRIALQVDGRSLELDARWSQASGATFGTAAVGTEVVIEVVEGDVAYVEPWALVEGRL